MSDRAPRFALRLGVVTHVPHWPPAGTAGIQPLAYEPYVREMAIWARLFEEVEVCAPRAEGPLRGSQAEYASTNVRWTPVDYTMGYGFGAQMRRLSRLPSLARALDRLVRRSDVVLLRSPGHPALVARPLTHLHRVPSITKWAGFFGPFDGERLPSRAERALVRREHWPVLVYGPATRPQLVSFSPAVMSDAELDRAAALGQQREWRAPWRILSVGRLMEVKGFDLALDGLARLGALRPDLPWSYTLVGDGPAAPALREQASRLGIAERVVFTGALPFSEVQAHYGAAHIVIMPGVKEGWPKPIAEAWAHGAVPLAAAAGIVPWVIASGSGGTFAPTGSALGDALAARLASPEALREEGERGLAAARALSLERFAAELERVLVERCHLR